MNPDMPAKPTRGLPLAIREQFFYEVWGKEDNGLENLTETQQKCLTYYYGLGTSALNTGKIQAILGVKNHSYVRGICAQGEKALDNYRKHKVLIALGQSENAKDIPLDIRQDYIKLMYGTELSYEGLSREQSLLFSSYYGLGFKRYPTDIKELRRNFGIDAKQILKILEKSEEVIAKNWRDAFALDLIKEWSEDVGRFCPRCGSTNIYLMGKDDNNSSEIKCKDCAYVGGEIVELEKLVVRLAG
mgnify:CR=1 FL=1